MPKHFKYQYTNPGNKPLPMIMMYHEPNQRAFDEKQSTTKHGT